MHLLLTGPGEGGLTVMLREEPPRSLSACQALAPGAQGPGRGACPWHPAPPGSQGGTGDGSDRITCLRMEGHEVGVLQGVPHF